MGNAVHQPFNMISWSQTEPRSAAISKSAGLREWALRTTPVEFDGPAALWGDRLEKVPIRENDPFTGLGNDGDGTGDAVNDTLSLRVKHEVSTQIFQVVAEIPIRAHEPSSGVGSYTVKVSKYTNKSLSLKSEGLVS